MVGTSHTAELCTPAQCWDTAALIDWDTILTHTPAPVLSPEK